MAYEQVSLVPREIRQAGFPTARFLTQEEQVRYEEACKEYSGKARDSLRVPINGSNLFKVLFLNQIGIRTASLGELECALENGLALQGQYEDAPAVVLRSANDSHSPNDYLAKSLAKDIGVKKFKAPLVVTGLEVVADDNSQYGLSFRKIDKTQVVEASDLDHTNHQRKFSRINSDYSIQFDEKGTRTLWTRDNGVSGLYLDRGSGLGSRGEGLAYSGDSGRVVVVNNTEGDAKNFDSYIAQLKLERDNQEADHKRRFDDAMNVLKAH